MSADINQEKKAESGNNDRSSSQIDDDQNEARLIGEAKVSDTAKDPEMEPQDQNESEEDPEVVIDPAVIEKLTTGTLGLFLPNLQRAKGALNEVLHNQEVLLETLLQENAKFSESTAMKELKQTMEQAKAYHSKLVSLKKEMSALMDKSSKLKYRAVKLQQQKQKEELNKAAQRERELERERMLTAKVARPVDKKPSS